MDYKLLNSKTELKHLGIENVPSNIDMFYDLSYQLSTYIFDYRMNHNLTQKDFAKLLGVKQPMVSKLESGNYNISLQSICDVMAKLDTRIEFSLNPADGTIGSGHCEMGSSDSAISHKVDQKELVVAA